MNKPLITSRTEWTEQLLHEVYGHIDDIATNDLRLEVYPNQIEVISAEQMVDAYSSVGLPVHYAHWSYGKSFMRDWKKYLKGDMGLAYEIVINSNPCISYLMEENNAAMQTLVIAHAAFGHNFVFKNNYLFKEWTDAGSIIDYMLFAKQYIRNCEEKYGEDEVEMVLDAAHALASHGVDKRKRKHKKKLSEEERLAKILEKDAEEQQSLNLFQKKMKVSQELEKDEVEDGFVADEENLLYFIYKNAPHMEEWKRELLRIVYKIQQYFYPQGQTKVLNEGFATHTHFYIIDELEKRGIISDDAMLYMLASHSGVVYQPKFDSRHYSGFNPYALGLDIFKDIRRICEEPTKEDEEWFPDLVGKDWREEQKKAASDYRDESFIEQFMSPKLIRDWRLFSLKPQSERTAIVKEISDDIGYREVRRDLSSSYNPINRTPEIVVRSARMKQDRLLTLEYRPFENRTLYKKYAKETLNHVKLLWGYDVELIEMAGGLPITLMKV